MVDSFFIFGAKYLFVLSLLIALFYFYKASTEVRKQMIIFAFISFPLAFIISLIARELYFNPRPFMISGLEPLVPHTPDNGFPSDHTLLVAAIASLLPFFNRRFALWLWFITIVVAFSLVYVGVHHFLDVLGSAIIAIISALFAYAIIRNTKLWKTTNNQTNF